MKKKNTLITRQNKKEIFYNVINSLLAGSLVFFGAFLDGEISRVEMLASFGSSAILIIVKFKEYWDGEQSQYVKGIANFL